VAAAASMADDKLDAIFANEGPDIPAVVQSVFFQMNVHSGFAPEPTEHVCDQCEAKPFSTKRALKRYKVNSHQKGNTRYCTLCQKDIPLHIRNFRNAHTPGVEIFRVTTSIMWGGFSFGKSPKKLENSFGENYHRYVMPVVIL
jgi:hypothetical protein